MKKIYKVTQAQLKTLQNGGTITVGGVQYTYETGEDVTYVVVDPSSPEYKLEQIDDKVELLKNGTVVSDLSIAYADRSGYSTYSRTMVYPSADNPEYIFSLDQGGHLSDIKDASMSNPNYSIYFPKTGGTIALTSDVSTALSSANAYTDTAIGKIDYSNFVTVSGAAQRITGEKMFAGGVEFYNTLISYGPNGNNGSLVLQGDYYKTEYLADGINRDFTYKLSFPEKTGVIAVTSDIPTKVSSLDNDAGYLTSHQDISGKYDKANVGLTTMAVTRTSSKTTAASGYWAAMCNSSQTGGPTLPTSGKWWHVISMDWSGTDPNNWYSQLALPTQDGGVPYYRRNNASGTTIESSTWHKFITDENISSQSVNYANSAGKATSDGNGDSISTTYVKKNASTSSATTGITASQSSHTHTLTPSGTNAITTTSTASGSAKTSITASSSAPTFTGKSATTNSATPTITISDAGHNHTYNKTTSATFTGSGSSVSITNGTITSTDAGHAHTYDKTTKVAFSGTQGTTSSATPEITITDNGHYHHYDRPYINYNASAHAISLAFASGDAVTVDAGCGIAASQASHTHTLTPSGTNTITTTSTATGSGKASITSSQAASSGSVTPKGTIALSYTKTDTDIDASTGKAVPVITGITATQASHTHTVTSSGTVSAPTITITDNGHTHTYDKTTKVTFTGTQGTTSSSTPSITITDNGHTHTV